MVIKFCSFIFLCLFSCAIFAEQESAKAIVQTSKDEGIILSEIAKKNIGFGTSSLVGVPPFKVPKSALVYSRDIIGVYLIKNRWIKMVPVKVISTNLDYALVESSALKGTSEIVTSGVPLVRVSEMEAFSTAE